jgi:hypothetical protein|tara:strand:+ start:745 stop:993 length:249 start_codon:yes stop_codon:yes gene_type:complete
MLRVIEENENFAVQKITDMKGKTIRYQVLTKAMAGSHLAVEVFDTLKEARDAAGIAYAPPEKHTPPNDAYERTATGVKLRKD